MRTVADTLISDLPARDNPRGRLARDQCDESATNGAVEVRIVAVGLVGAEIVPLGDLGADVDDDGTWLGV